MTISVVDSQKIHIERVDFDAAIEDGTCDPCQHALQRTFDTPWRTTSAQNVYQEEAEPWRAAILPRDATQRLLDFKADGHIRPFEFTVQLLTETTR